ncbi:MAG: hypothetical protein ACOCXZ_02305 [Chloroflexota bacterium]
MNITELNIEDIASHIAEADWLAEYENSLLSWLSMETRTSGERLDYAIRALLHIIPHIMTSEQIKKWGRLLENAFERTRYAEINGLDGDETSDVAGDVIMFKRSKVPQLPTKTKRRKRIIVHPSQMFEMYLILFMAYNYQRAKEITERDIFGLVIMGRAVRDAYCTGKLHQALAYLYNMRREGELALMHAHTAWNYWNRLSSQLECAQTAYALGTGYISLGDMASARRWLKTAASIYAETDHQRQYGKTALSTASIMIHTNQYRQAIQWSEIAAREYDALGSPLQLATALHYAALAHAYTDQVETAHGLAMRAWDILDELDQRTEVLHLNHTLAYIEANMGGVPQAIGRLEDTIAAALEFPESGWRDQFINACEQLIESFRSGQIRRPF